MKRVLVILEGAADLPVAELEQRTPLQVARCAHAARWAAEGASGLLLPVREGLDGRAEVLLSVCSGADESAALELQRGPLEARSADHSTYGYAVVYRGNLVTIDQGVLTRAELPDLREQETRTLADALQARWPVEEVRFAPLAPGRLSVMIRDGGDRLPAGYPPGFLEGEPVNSFLPRRQDKMLRDVFERAAELLARHPINEVRVDLGEDPANALWLWGGGALPASFSLFAGKPWRGTVLTQSRVAAGLARLCGMASLAMQDPWSAALEEPVFKLAALVERLRESEFLLVYAQAPRELGRYGSAVEKVRALERMDQFLLGPLASVLEAHRPYRLALLSDGLVSSVRNAPTTGNVPVTLAGASITADAASRWDEAACVQGALGRIRPADVWAYLSAGES
jgi:2,3-bisphosphoglycerate-independent phosphoglycerate mutase